MQEIVDKYPVNETEYLLPIMTFRVEDYFEHIFLSYEMKMAKPDEEIFRKVLDDAGLDPKETF